MTRFCNYVDTVEHSLFDCGHCADKRLRFTNVLRREPKPEAMQDFLCGPKLGCLPDDAYRISLLMAQAQRHQNGTNRDDRRHPEGIKRKATANPVERRVGRPAGFTNRSMCIN